MDSITSQFVNFSFISYLTLFITVLCLFFSKNLKSDRNNSPLWSLIIANFSFWYFIKPIHGDFDLYIQVITFFSIICICWFYWIKIEENETNKDRGFLKNGKDAISDGYDKAKQNLKNRTSDKVGGGLLGELLENTIDIGTRKIDSKVSGLLNFLGDSSEYLHESRGSINLMRNLIILSIIFSMFYIS